MTTAATVVESTTLAPEVPSPPPPSPTPATFGPVTKAERLVNIDFVRGIALLGILLVNVACFFGPLASLVGGRSYIARQPVPDQVALLFVLVLVTGKFISTFSILFGYGLLGQVERAFAAASKWAQSLPNVGEKLGESLALRVDGAAVTPPSPIAAQQDPPPATLEPPVTATPRLAASTAGTWPGWFAVRRLAVLAVFGLLHGLGLWYGDILFIYAALGVFVLLWRGNSAGSLLIIAGVMLGILVLLSTAGELIGLAFGGRPEGATTSTAAADGPRGLQAMIASRGNITSPVWVNAETAAYRDGPWVDAMTFRGLEWLLVVVSIIFGAWLQIVGMFALGAWLWRKQFFHPEQAPLRRRVLCIFLPLGLFFAAVTAGLFCLGLLAGSRAAWSVGGIVGVLAVCTLPLGYVSAFSLLAERLPGWLVNTVASAGRMALTVYLLETVIATFLSYHWGLGWFGQVSPWQQVVLALAIWTTLVLFSRLWLSYFAQGPMEWLWRKLEYGRPR